MFEITPTIIPVKYYGYREVFARNVIITHKRTRQTIDAIETEWAKQCGGRVDNHTTYKFESLIQKGFVFYVTCSDDTYYVGLSIDENAW